MIIWKSKFNTEFNTSLIFVIRGYCTIFCTADVMPAIYSIYWCNYAYVYINYVQNLRHNDKEHDRVYEKHQTRCFLLNIIEVEKTSFATLFNTWSGHAFRTIQINTGYFESYLCRKKTNSTYAINYIYILCYKIKFFFYRNNFIQWLIIICSFIIINNYYFQQNNDSKYELLLLLLLFYHLSYILKIFLY